MTKNDNNLKPQAFNNIINMNKSLLSELETEEQKIIQKISYLDKKMQN